jgi:Protein of unknown function (DUF3306)
MSEPEGFLSRWTRLKHEAVETPEPASKDAPDSALSEGAPRTAPDVEADAPPRETTIGKPAIDLSLLPSIESITATTDIRAFLSAGVPADLARAALRRAWSSDPAIRDFIGLSENSWDFNAPGGIPGFGPIDPAEVGRLVAQAIGKPEVAAAAGNAYPPPTQADQPQPCESGQTATASDASAASDQRPELQDHRAVASEEIMQRTKADVAVQEPPERSKDAVTSPRRSHGGALPE